MANPHFTPTPQPAPRTPASVAAANKKKKAAAAAAAKATTPTTTPAKPKYHNPGQDKPANPKHEKPKPVKTDTQTWLDKVGGAAAWHAKTAAIWKKNHPNAGVEHRPGIEQTVIDNNVLAKALFATPAAYKAAATTLANSMYNANRVGSELTDADTQERQGNITGVGTEYLKQLAGIQTASADAGTGAVNLFSQGAGAADQAANAAVIAAGGGTAGSTAPAAAVSLGSMAANTDNILAGQQAAAAQQNLLFHRQETENQRSGLAKLGAQKAADYATEYDKQQQLGDARVANDLTYNLYNQQNTTKRTLGNKTITLNDRIAKQKAWAATADRAIKEQQTRINADLAAGKITAQQAAKEKKGLSALQNVYTHQGGATAGGGNTYHIPITYPVTTTTQVWNPKGGPGKDGYEADGTTKVMVDKKVTTWKNTVLTASADQWKAFSAYPEGQRPLGQLKAPKGARRQKGPDGKPLPITNKPGKGSTSSGYTMQQAINILTASGAYTPAQAKALLAGYKG